MITIHCFVHQARVGGIRSKYMHMVQADECVGTRKRKVSDQGSVTSQRQGLNSLFEQRLRDRSATGGRDKPRKSTR